MVSSLASMERWSRRPSSAGPPPSPVHGASKAMLIDGRPGSPSDLCSTDSHVLRRKCGARYKMCSTAQPAPTVLEGSTCHSSYEGPRSGSSRSDHTGNPGVASVTEDPPSIRCEHATPEDACRLARRQADSAHLACGRTRSGESQLLAGLEHGSDSRKSAHEASVTRLLAPNARPIGPWRGAEFAV